MGRVLSRREVMSRYPGLPTEGLSGAAVFCDGQMYNAPRLVLSFVRSAVECGAVAANHLEATKFLRSGSRVHGLDSGDVLGGRGNCAFLDGHVAAHPRSETFPLAWPRGKVSGPIP